MIKFFFGASDNGGCFWYRCYIPSIGLRMHGMYTETRPYISSKEINLFNGFIFNRLWLPEVVFFLERSNVKFIADYDDNVFRVPPSNPAHTVYNKAETQKNIINALKKAYCVTVSNPLLVDEFGKFIDKDKIRIVPNHWYGGLYPPKEDEVVRIGWAGGCTHKTDLLLLMGVFTTLISRYKSKIKLVFLGPQWLLQDILKPLPQEYIEIHDWVPVNQYIEKLASLNIHIGLAPLDDVDFNRYKTPIKWYEYTQIGAATVATKIETYDMYIQHEKTGLLVKKNKARLWLDFISALIEDVSFRKQLVENAQKEIQKYNVFNCGRRWKNVLKEVYNFRDGTDIAQGTGIYDTARQSAGPAT